MMTISKKNLYKTIGLGVYKTHLVYNMFGLNTRLNKIKIKSTHTTNVTAIQKKFSYDGSLKVKMGKAVLFYIKLKNFKGTRHSSNYPVRGQRTHTNAKTRKLLKKHSETKKKTYEKNVNKRKA